MSRTFFKNINILSSRLNTLLGQTFMIVNAEFTKKVLQINKG